MDDSSNLDAAQADSIDDGVRIASHHAFACPVPDARSELQAECGDFLGLGQDRVKDLIRYLFPGDLAVMPFYGFEIAPRANGVFKLLSGHGAPTGGFRSVPAFHWQSRCDLRQDRSVLRWRP